MIKKRTSLGKDGGKKQERKKCNKNARPKIQKIKTRNLKNRGAAMLKIIKNEVNIEDQAFLMIIGCNLKFLILSFFFLSIFMYHFHN